MTEGAETGKIRFFVALYSERKDMYYFETPIGKSRWYAKQGACKTDAFLAECECKRRGWVQSSDLTEALNVAGEALYEIRWHLYNPQDMSRCRDVAEDALAALERIRNKG